MSGLERRLERLERRADRSPDRAALLSSLEVIALNSLLPEEDKRSILDLFETEDGGHEELDAVLARATPSELAAYRRYDALLALPVDLRNLETRASEDPEYLTPYLQSVDMFWRAGEDHGRDSKEAREQMRVFQRARLALIRELEESA